MKKIIPIIILVAVFISCKTFDIKQKPKAEIEKFDIESISLRDITLLFDIRIDNPYPIGLKLDDIGFTFYIENKQLFKTNTGKGFKIKSRGKKTSTFRVNLKYSDIVKIVKDYKRKDYLNCTVDVLILIPLPKIPGLQKNISFNYKLKKKIPAIKPTIKIVNFRVKKPSASEISDALKRSKKDISNTGKISRMFNDILSGKKPKSVKDLGELDVKLTVSFDIELKNDTKAKLLFNRLNYDFLIASEKLVNGETTDIKNTGNKSILKVNNVFSSRALSKSILNAFRRKKGEYKLKGHALIKLPDDVKMEPLKLKFDEKGNLNIK